MNVLRIAHPKDHTFDMAYPFDVDGVFLIEEPQRCCCGPCLSRMDDADHDWNVKAIVLLA